uniref:Uncharacterized protein n=1 Tax=Setaria italica TaxID=4555 RepID=K3ZZZ6_SETIT
MAHIMTPLSTAQNPNITLRTAPKSPTLKNSSNLSLGAKCDTRSAVTGHPELALRWEWGLP